MRRLPQWYSDTSPGLLLLAFGISDHLGGAALDTRLTETRYVHRRSVLNRQAEDGEELGDCVVRSKGLFNEIHRRPPPGKSCCEQPEVGCGLDASPDGGISAGCEEAASNSAANGQ